MNDPLSAADVSRRVGLPVAGASVGLLVGGPFGAVAGAALQPLAEIVMKRREVGFRKLDFLWQVTEDLTGLQPGDVADWAKQSEDRLDFASTVAQAAFDALSERKIRALARVLAYGLSDDARVEYGALVVGALRELEEPHIRVLHAMVAEVPPPGGRAGDIAPGAWCRTQLQAHLPGLSPGIGAVAAVLVRVGMIGEGLAANPDDEGENLAWRVLPFGVDCHRHLTAVAGNAESISSQGAAQDGL